MHVNGLQSTNKKTKKKTLAVTMDIYIIFEVQTTTVSGCLTPTSTMQLKTTLQLYNSTY